jgi:3-polyprenyl-4-hydroxybenzoate decarboxylase
MIVGGTGASEIGAGVEVVQDLQALDVRARAILVAR